MWRAVIYSLHEGLLALWRTKLVSLLSIGTIAVSFAVLGLFLLVSVNIGVLAETYGDDLIVHVFLKEEISTAQLMELRRRIESDDRVSSLTFIDKGRAAQRFRQIFPDEKGLLDELQNNPLPASFEVVLQVGMRTQPERVDALVESLDAMDGVEMARYDRRWVETLEATAQGITYFGAVLGGLLVLAAIVTAANIIKINIYARHEEIEIMELVGAEGIYVKGPFVVGGLVQGLLASILAMLVLLLLFHLGIGYLELMEIEILRGMEFRFLPLHFVALFLLGGLVVGLLASLLGFGRAGRS